MSFIIDEVPWRKPVPPVLYSHSHGGFSDCGFAPAGRTRRRSGAQAFGEKILRSVRELAIPHSRSTVSDHITVSIGGDSVTPQYGDSVLSLIGAADGALYAAKRAGKNRVVMQEGAGASAEPTSTL